MKYTISQRQVVILECEPRIFPANLWAFHMHSVANFVLCTILNFSLPKDEEKKIWKTLSFF